MEVGFGFACDGDVLIQWGDEKGIDEYNLYTLETNGLLNLFSTTADTFAIISKNQILSDFVSLAPVVGGIEGVRSFGRKVSESGVKCYYNYFNAAVNAESVLLSLNLSTLYNVDKVIFEKEVNGQFEIIDEIGVDKEVILNAIDDHLRSGYYTYRARIRLIDGSEITTDHLDIPVILPGINSVFPNPISPGEDLNFLISEPAAIHFSLTDLTGREVMRYELESNADSFVLNDIGVGLYIYRLISENGVVSSGRLIVQ